MKKTNFATKCLIDWINSEEWLYAKAYDYRSADDYAEFLKDYYENKTNEQLGESGFLLDLLNSELNTVDWNHAADVAREWPED